jgi:hypothetical protein
MRTRPVLTAAVTAAVAALTAGALAAPSGTTVTSATRSGSTVTAAGTATFSGVSGPVSVGGTNTEFAQPPVSGPAGFDLVDALVGPLPDGKGLRFTWKLRDLPAQVPPEGVRYTWSFAIGDATFQLQAKRTNLASVTTPDDPQGHVTAAAAGTTFQLRGNCGTTYMDVVPLSNCPHLRFLPGAFNTATDTVTMDLPFGAAPAIVPGAQLTEVQAAGMSISAGLQAVASVAQVSDFINGWTPYAAGPTVGIATGTATANPLGLNYAAAALDGTSWTGTLSRVSSSHTRLYVRTCEGLMTECTYTSAPLS